MIPAGWVECLVLKADCKFYDDYRYFYPSMGETVILPEYQAYLFEKDGIVEILETEIGT